MTRRALLVLFVSLCTASYAQEPVSARPDSTLDHTIEAGESGTDAPRIRLVRWNEYEGRFFSLRLGATFLYDVGAFVQDDASREQFELEPGAHVRDSRIVLGGRIMTKRSITWSAGFMYDGANKDWFIRQTGVMIGVPELKGHLWLGRAKEGFSQHMVMVGTAGFGMERSPIVVATVPLLADGVKWLGQLPKFHLLYNIGFFTDLLSEGQSFSSYDSEIVGRVLWLPVQKKEGHLLTVGFSGRYGLINDRSLRLRGRPEVGFGPYFVNTEYFAARDSYMGQVEVYYRPGPLVFGLEYFAQQVSALDLPDPFFHGGDVTVSWLITGETRGYNTVGGYFKAVSPKRSLFKGGPGAWEAVLRMTYIDLDDGPIQGGAFWRITPMVNWHMSDNVRLELCYGVGQLDRFGLLGTTQFFQSRIQFQL